MRFIVELYPYETDDVVLYVARLCGGRLRCISRATYILFLLQYQIVRDKVVLRFSYNEYPITMAQFFVTERGIHSNEVMAAMDVHHERVVGGCPEVRCDGGRGCREVLMSLPAPVRMHIRKRVEKLCSMTRPELAELVYRIIGMNRKKLIRECMDMDVEYCMEGVAGRRIVGVEV